MCVWGGERSERIWKKCVAGKGKEDEKKRLLASVLNSPSAFLQGYTMQTLVDICHGG